MRALTRPGDTPLPWLTLLACLVAGLALGCGDDATEEAPADTSAPDLPKSEEDAPQAANYPSGPYGATAGETIEDLEFYDPEAEGPARLSQWYQHPKAKLLMLVSTAAW
jgi:hypothetical protein